MFLSKLFGIFKKNKDPEQQAPGASGSKGSNVVSPGTVTGGAAASSGLSNQNPASPPSQPVADASGQVPDTNNTVSSQVGDTAPPNDTQTVAQANSAPSYSNEEPASSAPEESTEAISTPDADSYQSGSTDSSMEEPKLPPDNESPSQPPESGSNAPEDDSNNTNPDDQSAGGGASIG